MPDPRIAQVVAQHIAGLPVEELLLAALAAAAPMIALVGWEIRTRLKRLRSLIRRSPDPIAGENPPTEASQEAN